MTNEITAARQENAEDNNALKDGVVNSETEEIAQEGNTNAKKLEIKADKENIEETKGVKPKNITTIPAILGKNNIVLKAVEGPLTNNTFIVNEEGVSLGRHSASNQIVISESYVSRRHCQIICKGDCFYISDLGSTTGTFMMLKGQIELKKSTMIFLE